MPHLAPMYWLLMPLCILFLLYIINSIMYYISPPLFKMPKTTSMLSIKWFWN